MNLAALFPRRSVVTWIAHDQRLRPAPRTLPEAPDPARLGRARDARGAQDGWHRLPMEFKAEPEGPQDRAGIAIVVLGIGAAMLVTVGLVLTVMMSMRAGVAGSPLGAATLSGVAAAFIAFAGSSLVVAWGLRWRRPWAWTASVILFTFYLPSPFLPLALVGFFAVLGRGTRAAFRGAASRHRPGRSPSRAGEAPAFRGRR